MLREFGYVNSHNLVTVTVYVKTLLKTLPHLPQVKNCTDYKDWPGKFFIVYGTNRFSFMLKQSRNGYHSFDCMKVCFCTLKDRTIFSRCEIDMYYTRISSICNIRKKERVLNKFKACNAFLDVLVTRLPGRFGKRVHTGFRKYCIIICYYQVGN